MISDLDGFALEPDDIKQLRKCRLPGDCDVQLPAEFMEDFQKTVDWSAPNAAVQVNDRARKLALEALARYQKGGNRALGSYHDKQQQVQVADGFENW